MNFAVVIKKLNPYHHHTSDRTKLLHSLRREEQDIVCVRLPLESRIGNQEQQSASEG
jgi:hypothetical protein